MNSITKHRNKIDPLNKEFNSDNIWVFKYKYNLTKKDLLLLLEMVRRKYCLYADYKFVGLGCPSRYKSGYFVPSFKEYPRMSNWYKLSAKGEQMLINILDYFSIPDDRDTFNTFLWNFIS